MARGVQSVHLIQQYRQMHRDPKVFAGTSVLMHAYWIKRLLARTGSRTLLDYGSGKGAAYKDPYRLQDWWGVMPDLYDPAVAGLDTPPSGRWDGVICMDVLEHIEEKDIPETLATLFSHAKKFLLMTVCPRLSSRELPDGRNCHITVRPAAWWEAAMLPHKRIHPDVRVKLVITP